MSVIKKPKNTDVARLNEETLPGEENVYRSADFPPDGEADESTKGLYVTAEFLNSISLSGLPPHLLTIKVGCVMMLLRNLNPKRDRNKNPHHICDATNTENKDSHGKFSTPRIYYSTCDILSIE